MRSAYILLGLVGSLALTAACSALSSNDVFTGTGEAGTGGNTSSSESASSTGTDGDNKGEEGDIFVDGGGGGAGGGDDGSCVSGPDEDKDKDGFSISQGDCNDCDPNVNPGAIEVIATPDEKGNVLPPADEDCDGQVDNILPPCDDGIALADADPMNGARAIGLCQKASPSDKKWGVLDAKYVRANGSPTTPGLQIGIEPKFGPNVNVQNGSRMLVMSSGHARAAKETGACNQKSCKNHDGVAPPPGFPQDVPNCDGASNINDDIGLEVKLRAPKNATGYAFDFFFYSFEYPEWVCKAFNDQFVAIVNPPPKGSINGNITFDSKGNPVSVNIAFFSVCTGCALGTKQLAGTGFDQWDNAGGTSWLSTQAPVKGGDEISIRFAIWDTGDQEYDSTTLIDNFRWIANGGTVTVGTDPVPIPK